MEICYLIFSVENFLVSTGAGEKSELENSEMEIATCIASTFEAFFVRKS